MNCFAKKPWLFLVKNDISGVGMLIAAGLVIVNNSETNKIYVMCVSRNSHIQVYLFMLGLFKANGSRILTIQM